MAERPSAARSYACVYCDMHFRSLASSFDSMQSIACVTSDISCDLTDSRICEHLTLITLIHVTLW